MQQLSNAIGEYLEVLGALHGNEYRSKTTIQLAGGKGVIITFPEGHNCMVSVGRLELMTESLRSQAGDNHLA